MVIFWKIRYLDRTDRQFKDRNLYLNTMSLDPITRATIELVTERQSPKTEWEILKYKHLFIERTPEDFGDYHDCDRFMSVGPCEYREDETGKVISDDEIARILTGSPTARSIPMGAQQYDIDFMLADPKPIPIAEIVLSTEDVRVLGYFVRDMQEIFDSAFIKDRPCTLHVSGPPTPTGYPYIKTPASDEEIRSFVTIFRRLYMDKEPANFQKTAAVFVKALGDDRYANLIEGMAKDFEQHLEKIPETFPFIQPVACTFKTKRLIDVFLYTQYAHQPDEKRQRQFNECLAELQGKRPLLIWMFLTEMWKLSLEIGNAGKVISRWFKQYCDQHGVTPDVLNSLREHHAGLGAAEKEVDRQARLFQEKVEQLAADLWKQADSPNGGSSQYVVQAREQLTQSMNV